MAKQSFASVAARTVKIAYDALKQGAELEAARGRFENLTSNNQHHRRRVARSSCAKPQKAWSATPS
jgi:hypothetical protein